MGMVDKDQALRRQELPGATGELPGASPGRVGRLGHGISVADVLRAPSLAGSRLLAGAGGLDRIVSRINVMEVPDILPWVKPDELLLTTGYPLRESPEQLAELPAALHARGVAALAVKLGRYLDALPSGMLQGAESVNLPIIQVPDGVAFDDILNQVLTDVLNRQAAVLARSEEVHRALVQAVLAGGDIEDVCDALAGILDACVLVTTPDGRVLTQAGDPGQLATFVVGSCFDRTGRFRTESERRGVGMHDGLVGSHVILPVVAGSLDHGRLVVAATRILSEADEHVLEVASTVLALAITKSLAVAAVEERYRGDFLRDVLAGRAGSPEEVIAHAAGLGWDLARPVAVVVAELDSRAEMSAPRRAETGLALRAVGDRFATAWHAVLAARDPHAAGGGSGAEVVAIVGVPTSASSQPDGLMRLVRDLVRAVAGDGGGGRVAFTTGVSRAVDPVSGPPDALPLAYEQARTAMRVGRQLHGPGAVAHFDGLGVLRLLSLVPDGREVDAFVTETLRDLAAPHDPEAIDLRRTLTVLLEENLNVAQAARRLHYHYNTLRYRIAKLERLLGPFTRDSRLRLELMLALQVMALQEDTSTGVPGHRPGPPVSASSSGST